MGVRNRAFWSLDQVGPDSLISGRYPPVLLGHGLPRPLRRDSRSGGPVDKKWTRRFRLLLSRSVALRTNERSRVRGLVPCVWAAEMMDNDRWMSLLCLHWQDTSLSASQPLVLLAREDRRRASDADGTSAS